MRHKATVATFLEFKAMRPRNNKIIFSELTIMHITVSRTESVLGNNFGMQSEPDQFVLRKISEFMFPANQALIPTIKYGKLH
jgi:hypothetical protein